MTAAAVAILVRQQKDVVEAFRRAGAISPATAASLNAVGLDDNRALARLEDRAIIRSAAPGLRYLDEASWDALTDRRRRGAGIAIVVLAVAAVALLIRTARG